MLDKLIIKQCDCNWRGVCVCVCVCVCVYACVWETAYFLFLRHMKPGKFLWSADTNINITLHLLPW